MRFLGRVARFWVILAVLAVAGYFGIYNQEETQLHLPPLDQVTRPAWHIYMAFFLGGAFVATFYFIFDTFGKSLEIRKLKRRLKDLGPGHETDEPRVSLREPQL